MLAPVKRVGQQGLSGEQHSNGGDVTKRGGHGDVRRPAVAGKDLQQLRMPAVHCRVRDARTEHVAVIDKRRVGFQRGAHIGAVTVECPDDEVIYRLHFP